MVLAIVISHIASLCNPDSYIHITCYNELISIGIQQSEPSGQRKA